jgi:hypothetical protein
MDGIQEVEVNVLIKSNFLFPDYVFSVQVIPVYELEYACEYIWILDYFA